MATATHLRRRTIPSSAASSPSSAISQQTANPPESVEEEIPPTALTATSSTHYLWPLSLFQPSNVLDSNDYYWNAGSFAPAAIQIHLGSVPVYVTRVSLEAVMVPAMGKVRHEIRTGLTAGELRTACWYNGVTIDGEWLHLQLSNTAGGDLRSRSCFLEIRTHESPGWVAWRRVRVWRAVV